MQDYPRFGRLIQPRIYESSSLQLDIKSFKNTLCKGQSVTSNSIVCVCWKFMSKANKRKKHP